MLEKTRVGLFENVIMQTFALICPGVLPTFLTSNSRFAK
jgi:hypothetical protein